VQSESLKLGHREHPTYPQKRGTFTCQGCHSRRPQAGWIQQQECNFSLCWRLEVQDQGVSRVGFSRGPTPWFAYGHRLAVPSHVLHLVPVVNLFAGFSSVVKHLPSMCKALGPIPNTITSTSTKDTIPIRLGYTPLPHFYLSLLFKDPVTKPSHILRYWG
jgi:hypothetical protein